MLANTLEPDLANYQGAAVEAQSFASALGLLGQGLHENDGAGGLLAADNLWRAQQITPTPSTRDVAPDDLHRFGGVVEAELFAAAEQVDCLERSGQAPSYVSRVAQQQASAALLEAAALSTVPLDGSPPGGTPGPLLGSAVHFAALATVFDRLQRGLNPAGYPPDYVPFDYDPQSPTEDLFQQMLQAATQQVSSAVTLEGALRQSSRDFEASSQALDTALLEVASEAQSEVVDLCGSGVDPQTGDGCGQGGKIGVAYQDMQAAQVDADRGRHALRERCREAQSFSSSNCSSKWEISRPS